MSKRLLFITTRLFWPTDDGRKVSLFYYCKGLHERYGYDIYLYSFLEAGQSEEMLAGKPSFIKDVKIASSIGIISKIKNLIVKSALLKKWPLQCSLFYSSENSRRIAKYVSTIQPDIIMVDMVRLGTYYKSFEKFKCKKIMDMDDLLSNRYERQLNSSYKTSIVGQYGASLSSIVKTLINLNFVKKFILNIERELMWKAEIAFGKVYDKVIFVSQKECQILNKYIGDKSIAIPIGIYKQKYLTCKYNPVDSNTLCFIGNMQVSANIDTLKMIVEKVCPMIKSQFKLIVIGKCNENLKAEYKSYNNIVFTGRVENIYEYAGRSSIFLAPIAYGSGIKTKILEAMAMQLPVITNSIGAEGLDMINNEHFIVEDDYQVLAKKVDYYLKNKKLAKSLAENGQRQVFAKYDWENIWSCFKQVGI